MKFVHPNVLYLLLLLIIPIIIHLFNFRRYKKLYFSSLQFLKKVEKETSATRTLRHYIILASRLLAFTALVLAFAQPYFPSANEVNSVNNVVPIYLDNSFSMTAKGSNGDLLNQGKAVIRQIADVHPLEQRYMLVTNELSGFEHRIITRAELNDRVDDISFSPISRTIPNALSSMKEHLQSIHFDGDVQYYIISDFQKQFLEDHNVELDTNARYSFLQIEPQLNRNLFIDSIWFDQPFQRVNVNNTLNVRIQNTGTEKLTNVEVNLNVGSTKRQLLADLEAENNTVVSINYTNRTIGIKEGWVEIVDENLYFDNRFYFSYEIKENVNVLIINEQNSVPFPRYVYQTDDYYFVQETSIEQLKTEALNDAHLLVLNGLSTISSGLSTQLDQLVKNGVLLLIIPSPDFNITSYNNLLSNFQLPLYREVSNQEVRIGKVMSEMDFFTGMFDEKIDQLRLPPLKNYILSSTYNNANYNPLILYENGMPLFVEQAKGKNVYAFYSPIHPTFNDFGKSALFSSVLLRIGEVSQGKNPLSLILGSSEGYKVRDTNPTENALVLKKNEMEFIPEMEKSAGITTVSVRHAIDNQSIEDGVYQITSNGNHIGSLALNYNRLESDMDYATPSEITHSFKSLGITKINTEGISTLSDIPYLTLKKPNEFWRILLILALTFFLVEMLIIIFWKV